MSTEGSKWVGVNRASSLPFISLLCTNQVQRYKTYYKIYLLKYLLYLYLIVYRMVILLIGYSYPTIITVHCRSSCIFFRCVADSRYKFSSVIDFVYKNITAPPCSANFCYLKVIYLTRWCRVASEQPPMGVLHQQGDAELHWSNSLWECCTSKVMQSCIGATPYGRVASARWWRVASEQPPMGGLHQQGLVQQLVLIATRSG